MKPKPKHDGWCAFDPEGKIIPMLLEFGSKYAWAEMVLLAGKTKARLRKEGYTVRKVMIVPLED